MTLGYDEERLQLPGLALKLGRASEWDARTHVEAHDFLALNLGDGPLVLEHWVGSRGRAEALPVGAFWVNPGEQPMSRRALGPGRFLAISMTSTAPGLLELGMARPLPAALSPPAPQLAHLATALVAEARAGNPNGLGFVYDVFGALRSGLTRLVGVPSCDLPKTGALAPRALARVRDLVEAKLDAGLSVADMADVCELSLHHFSRAFRQSTGLSPHRFVMRRRAERARKLLFEARLSLSQIAVSVGYVDHSHFSREFRREMGVSPSELRRRLAVSADVVNEPEYRGFRA